jgi:hypothetical protein
VLTLIALAPVPGMAGYDASAGAGSVYVTDPVKLELLLAG